MVKNNLDKEYISHAIFSDLELYINFYNSLSNSIFRFINPGTKNIINFETYLLSSIKGTIESIKLILAEGKINDAYALTRKYDDSVITHIYNSIFRE